MKRHPSLEPFSRDHNAVLILARRLATPETADAALFRVRDLWHEEMEDHFKEEERLLGPLLTRQMASRLKTEHRSIATRVARIGGKRPPNASELSDMLDRHVRWEERELFPAIERTASAAQLQSLAESIGPMEKRRGETSFAGRRQELVASRKKADNELPLQDLAYLAQVARVDGPQWGFASTELNGTLLSFKRGKGVESHVNDAVDVLMVAVSGEGLVALDESDITLKAGETVLLPKGRRRAISALSERFSYLNVHRRREALRLQMMPGKSSGSL